MITNIYQQLLFLLDPEQAHTLALRSLTLAHLLKIDKLYLTKFHQPLTCMGLTFENPLGLAAGFDKNADCVDALGALGFGFLEVGTVTPKPQLGNPKPRLFRIREKQAIINRLGFNNKGVDYVVSRLKKIKYRGILGINIGKNRDTPLIHAVSDYLFCFKHLHPFASYITINISSPNTEGLRSLQNADNLQHLLNVLKQEQSKLTRYVPLVVKISPDLTKQELKTIATILLEQKIDGVIATNTTITRPGLDDNPLALEKGGLSGSPLAPLSTGTIKELHSIVGETIPIIASGGIMNKENLQEKKQAGATLFQVYSGFIYQGPKIIKQLLSI